MKHSINEVATVFGFRKNDKGSYTNNATIDQYAEYGQKVLTLCGESRLVTRAKGIEIGGHGVTCQKCLKRIIREDAERELVF